MPNSPSLQLGQEMTVSFWARLDSEKGVDGNHNTVSAGRHCLFSKDSDQASRMSLMLNTSDKRLRFSGGGPTVAADAPYTLGSWMHITVTVSPTKIVVYVNGQKALEEALSAPWDFSASNERALYIGGLGGTYWYPFYGAIDEFRMYNRALSEDEIEGLYEYQEASSFEVVAPGEVTAGEPFSVVLKARDSSGNPVPLYRGNHYIEWTWTANDSPNGIAPVKPSDGYVFFGGGTAAVQGFTLTEAVDGNDRVVITARELGPNDETIATGVSNPIAVKSGKGTVDLEIQAPDAATSGELFDATVVATMAAADIFGNPCTGRPFTGTIAFASDDPEATLPKRYAFTESDGNTKVFSDGVAFERGGERTLWVSEVTLDMPDGYWKFDERLGNTATDFSGNRNTGTLVGGGPWERNDGAPGIAFDNPGGITFDGIGQHIIAGDGAGTGISLSGRPFTIAFWAKRTKSGEQWIVSQGYGLEAKGLHVGFRDNTTFTLGFWNDDLNVTIPADNEWHHWAVTFDPSTNVQQVYRDGALVGHRVSKKDLQSSGYLNIGRRFDRTGYFGGGLDDLRLYYRVLSAEEIGVLASGGGGVRSWSATVSIPVEAPEPVLAWTLTGDVITLTFDQPVADPLGKHGLFSAEINGQVHGFTSAALHPNDPNRIDLLLDGTVNPWDEVKLRYAVGAEDDPVVSVDRGELQTFSVPMTVRNFVPRKQLISAGDYHSLAITPDGKVWAWGDWDDGQLSVPSNLSGAIAVSGGGQCSAALLGDGTIRAWGGAWIFMEYPQPGDAVAVAAGGSVTRIMHELILRSDGSVMGWGDSYDGQAEPPAGLTDVVAISAAREYSLALRADGTVVGWGDNGEGQSSVPATLNLAPRLSNLEISGATLAPAFNQDTTGYAVFSETVGETISVTATLEDSRNSLKINEVSAQSGVPVELDLGSLSDGITVKVTSPDATIPGFVLTRTYTLDVVDGTVYLHVSPPDSVVAGEVFSVQVTAKDEEGQIITGYAGNHDISWTWDATASPDGTPPVKPSDGPVTFVDGVATVGGFMLTRAPEVVTIEAWAESFIQQGTPLKTVTVTPGTDEMALLLETPAAVEPEQPFDVKVSITGIGKDAYDNPTGNTVYTGTIAFASDDPEAELPEPYTFSAEDNNAKVFNNLLFKQEGSFSLWVAEVPTGSIDGYWRFDEGEGQTVLDFSGNKHNGTLTNTDSGARMSGTGGPPVGFENPGWLRFDGSNDYMTAGSLGKTDLKDKSFTVAFWARRTKSGEQWIVSQGTRANNTGLHIGFRNDYTFTLGFWYNDLDVEVPVDTNWHHWAVTFDTNGRYQRIYRDGVLLGTRQATSNLLSEGPFLVGKRFDSGSTYFGGQFDDLHVYYRVLSPEEIASLAGGGGFTRYASVSLTVRELQPPQLYSAATDTLGRVITLTFDKPMADPAGKHGAFTFRVNDGAPRGVSAAALDGLDNTKITLTVDGDPIEQGQTVTLSYSPASGDEEVVALDGSVLQPFANFGVAVNALFGGGSGTSGDPFVIKNAVQLDNVRQYVNVADVYFSLAADIDLNVAPYNQGEGWEPIGSGELNAFKGTLFGNGKTISGLKIDRAGTDYVGLFGAAVAATIEDVHLTDVDVQGQGYVGALVGGIGGGTVTRCSATGSVTGASIVGGLVGGTRASSISQCYSMCSVYSVLDYAGGLVGACDQSSVVSNSYATGPVRADRDATGGVVGFLRSSTIDYSYSAGPVSGGRYVGGLVGLSDGGTSASSYWDTEVSGKTTSAGGEGKTTAQMKKGATFGAGGWDLVNVWAIEDGATYPYLKWQTWDTDQARPVVTFVPQKDATGVSVSVKPVITFDEPVCNADGSEITQGDLASLVTFREGGASGTAAGFSALINAQKTAITVTPLPRLGFGKTYYLAIAPVADAAGNTTTQAEVTFTTEDAPTISADHSSVVRTSASPVQAGLANIDLKVTIADDQGNPVSGVFWVEVDSIVPGYGAVHTTYDFDENGEAIVTVSGTAAGTYEGVGVRVSMDQVGPWVEVGTFDVTVTSAAPHGISVAAEITRLFGGGDTSVITATVADQYGNKVPDVTVDFTTTGSGTLTGPGVTDGDGKASATYTSSEADIGSTVIVTVQVNGTDITGNATIAVTGPDISDSFTDSKFKQAVWEWLGNPQGSEPGEFSWQDLCDMMDDRGYSLDVSNRGIASLAGLEHFEGTGLVALYCSGNELTTLPQLPQTLKTLYVRNTRITGLPDLPAGLQHLDCSSNRLASLPPLPASLSIIDCSKNYLNVFSGDLKAALEACGATSKTVTPQYRYTYTGETVELVGGQKATITAESIERQMTSDGSAWTPDGETDLDDFTFHTDDSDTATVSAGGVITATGAGSCTIYAYYMDVDSVFTQVAIPVTVSEGGPVPAPTLEGGETSIDGSVVTLAFSKPMSDPTGKHGQFNAAVDGNARAFTSATLRPGDPNKIDLVLSEALEWGQVVTVSYTPGTVMAADGGLLESFTDRTVTNKALFGGGKGISDNPYLIKRPEHLDNVRHCLDAHYLLVNDINLSAYLNGTSWEPIGGFATGTGLFRGCFDGNGKSITGLYVDKPTFSSIGLFGYTSTSAVIENLHLRGVQVTGSVDVGALVGLNYGNIIGCSATGSVSGDECVGGLAGSSKDTISRSYFAGSVEGSPPPLGGGAIGGLVGYNFEMHELGQITDSYAVAYVEGPWDVGGLVGYDEGDIARSFAAGLVSGESYTGGLVGIHDYDYGGSITDSYYDRETSGQEYGTGEGDIQGVTGVTTAQAKSRVTFGMGWDFDSVWSLVDGATYPYLKWQTTGVDFAPPVFASGYPAADNIGASSTDLIVMTDEDATVYYVALPASADRPTAQEVSQGKGKDGSSPVTAGSIGVDGGAVATVTIGGLQPQTSYDIYVVAEDASGNLQPDPSVAIVQVTTEAAPVDAHTVTFAVVGGNGTLAATADGSPIASGVQVTKGARVVFTATPDPGYHVKEWKVNGVSQTETGNTLTVESLSAPVAVTVGFYVPSLPVLGGTVSITGTPKYGEVLTADISAITYTPPATDDVPRYQWQRDGQEIPGATGSEYTLTVDDIGKRITVTVTADGVHAAGSVTSGATQVVEKADGPSAPTAPELLSKTHNSVTLKPNSAHQFRVNGGPWQDSNVFTGLLPSTTYTFTARVKETATHKASGESAPLTVTTDEAPSQQGPAIIATSPASGATGVSVDTDIVITFSKSVYETVYFQNIIISADASVIDYVYHMDDTHTVLTLDPVKLLDYYTRYTVVIPAMAVIDSEGRGLNEDFILQFTTAVRPTTGTTSLRANIVAGAYKMSVSASRNPFTRSITVNLGLSTLYTAFSAAEAGVDGIKTVTLEMPKVQGTKTHVVELPAAALASEDSDKRLVMATESGSLTLPSNMLEGLGYEGIGRVGISIGSADKSALPDDIRQAVGVRPVVELTMTVDGERREWNNPDAPVTVSIPYTPTPEELENPEHITVWYVDGAGNVHAVTSGRYDPETGTVTFTATHFSHYAVVYVEKTFEDLENVAWAKEQIEVLASKGILHGLTETEYGPSQAITRADYLYFLVRTLGVSARFEGNFEDVPEDAYYFEEIGVAKKLGITLGVGDNKFDPASGITRQDMMVLTERTLRMLGILEVRGSASDLDRFSDSASVAEYAVDSVASLVNAGLIQGDGEGLNPLGPTTKAEAAVFLYRMYNMR